MINVLTNELINDTINDSIKDGLTKTEKAVFDLICNRKKYSKNEIAARIDKSPMTVQRAIKSLIEKGLIKRVGSNKSGYWTVV